MLQDWVGLPHSFTVNGDAVEVVGQLTYLGSVINSNRLTAEEVSARIHKVRAIYASLNCLQ